MTDSARQDARRTDRQYRIGLSQQQSDPGLGNPEPDQPGPRRADAGVERPPRDAARAGQAGRVGEEVDDARNIWCAWRTASASKSLKRHLRTQYNMTPEQYRDKWGLPPDYPMVAPNYAVARSQLAKKMGLGQQARKRKIALSSEAIRRVKKTRQRKPAARAPRARRSGCARPSSAGRWSAAASDGRGSRIRRIRASASVAQDLLAACGRNNSVSRIAIRPRTMWASLSPEIVQPRFAVAVAVDLPGQPDLADAAIAPCSRRNARPPATARACGRVR